MSEKTAKTEKTAKAAKAAPTKAEPKAQTEPQPTRLAVRKTYKLFIGGAFPRSESGRSYQVTSADGAFLANAALASRNVARPDVPHPHVPPELDPHNKAGWAPDPDEDF